MGRPPGFTRILPVLHRFDFPSRAFIPSISFVVTAALVDKYRVYRAEVVALHADDTVRSENRTLIFIYGYIIPRAHAVAEPTSCAFGAVTHEEFLGIIRKGL